MNNNINFLLFLLFCFGSCKKYEQDSIYEPTTENKPVVHSVNYSINGEFVTFNSKIVSGGKSNLLRYGHLWGSSSTLKFINNQYLDSTVYPVTNAIVFPHDFETVTNNFEHDKTLYFLPFAINEAGISYGDPIAIMPQLFFDRYEIIQEQINDKKINPGETVKLRFYFKNISPINSVGTKIESIVELSDYIVSVSPLQNINLNPQLLSQGNESYADAQFVFSNNSSAFIEIEIILVDSNGKKTNVKQIDNKKIRININ